MQFVDNIRGVRAGSLQEYVQSMSLLRIYAHLRYAHVRVEVLKITQHPEDATVKVRWRVIGVPGIFSLRFWSMWRFGRKPVVGADEPPQGASSTGVWHDGFSIFYINSDGLIQRHQVEPVTPDDGRKQPIMNKLNKVINAKLGVLGVVIAPTTTDTSWSALVDIVCKFL